MSILTNGYKMWQSQNGQDSIMRRSIELQYANAQRRAAVRRLPALGALLALLAYDLWHWGGGCGGCGGWAVALAAGEALAAVLLAGSCARHAARLLPRPPRPACGLPADGSRGARTPPPGREEPGSLSPSRSWRAAVDSPPPSPPTPPSPPSPRSLGGRASPEEFISDGRALAAYIREQEAREGAGAGVGAAVGGARVLAAPTRAHQLAVLPERGTNESCAGDEEGIGAPGAGGAPLWRRLHLDPQRLTEYNLNLRLWLHVSVVGRVARELAAAEAGGGGGGARADALLPFLRPFADRQYVADRIKELSRGGCLSAYRWASGARGWHAGRPADAELLLHLLAAYLDLVVPAGDFSARHISAPAAPAPAAAPAAAPPGTPVLHRAARHPPHYVLLLGDETIELPRGRNNLLHTLLLFLAAVARGAPPALCRMHLGPAGLNMLWILGR